MKKAILLSVLAFSLPAIAAEPTIAGSWDVSTSVAGNDGSSVCNFVVKEKILSGTCTGEDGAHPLTGKIDGTKISWSYASEYNGTPLTIKFEGNLSSEKLFKGTVDVDPMGVSGDFSAKRKA